MNTNPYYDSASRRLLDRGYRGGQHSAHHGVTTRGEIAGAIDRLWHSQHGNHTYIAHVDQQAALAEFEAERRLATELEASPW